MNSSAMVRLESLRVADVMSTRITQVSEHSTMGEVADLFLSRSITAAPVVSRSGEFLGMLCSRDFFRWIHQANYPAASAAQRDGSAALEASTGREDAVRLHMSRAVQTIPAGASLLTAARIMCAQHEHRLPALDEAGRVVGLITTMDIVAAVVNAVDEMHVDLLRGT